MSYRSVIYSESFWQFLKLVVEKKGPFCLEDICLGQEINEVDVQNYLEFINTSGFEVQQKLHEDGKVWLYSQETSPKISFDFDLADWFALQAYFPKITENTKVPYFKVLADKLEKMEEQYPQYDLFCALDDEKKRNFIKNNPIEYIKDFEKCLNDKRSISVKTDSKEVDVYIHRLVFLEKELCVIGEDISERCLIYFPVKDVKKVGKPFEREYEENYSSQEVNEFIEAMRNLTDNEKRLVLKIPAGGHIDLNPNNHFLGRPYITTNLEGDIIWAASVETSDELFEWLLSIKDQVEILDPASVKREFLEFCERKIADNKKPAA